MGSGEIVIEGTVRHVKLNGEEHLGCLEMLTRTARGQNTLPMQSEVDQLPKERDKVPVCRTCGIILEGKCRREFLS